LGPGLHLCGRDIFASRCGLGPARHDGGHYGQLPQIEAWHRRAECDVGVPPTVAIQRISTGIDTGDILLQARVPLFAQDTFTSIRDRSYFMTKVMLALAARRILDGELVGTPQSAAAGRQYYRLHPALQRHADHALRQLLPTGP
jgi:hypothetical protein